MNSINFELVYKLRRYNTNSLQNITVQLKNDAIDKANQIHEEYRKAIAKAINTEDFEVSNVCCMADGISSHVYRPAKPENIGKRKCIFCDCDDFPD